MADLIPFPKVREGLDRTGQVLAVAAGTVAASLSGLHAVAIDPLTISRIRCAVSSHGVAAADLLARLPGELEHCGANAVEAFLKGGDAAAHGAWEDGTVNVRRGAHSISWPERVRASADNHLDGLIAAARTPQFWQRTLGNAVEASVYSAAITAVDQLLVHREALLNGTPEDKTECLQQILRTSGLIAAGALPVSLVLSVALMLVPGLAVVLGPLGVLGSVGLGLRLISSAVLHPSQQEVWALRYVEGLRREWIYALRRDRDGTLTITVQAEPVG
ncbi:MAG: hypothetical protein ACK587_05435 [Cyanobacteriota bacterium]|jgi:hypothetical protein